MGYLHIQEKTSGEGGGSVSESERESVRACVSVWVLQEEACYISTCVGNPPHNTREQNNVKTTFLLFSSLSEDPSSHMQSGVKQLKHSQKGRSHLSCNAWTHSFLNTVVHPTIFSIRNTGLEETSRNHLHHSLLRQGKHYLDIKGIPPDCSTVSILTTKHPPAFFSMVSFLPAQTWSGFT